MKGFKVYLPDEEKKELYQDIHETMKQAILDARADTAVDREFLRKKDAAIFANVSQNTLENWIHMYRLPVHRVCGVTIVLKDELVAWMRKR